MSETMRLTVYAALLIALLTACETRHNPSTGETRTDVTFPGTAAHEARIEQRWRRCVRFRSTSQCNRRYGRGVRPGRSAPNEPYVQR